MHPKAYCRRVFEITGTTRDVEVVKSVAAT